MHCPILQTSFLRRIRLNGSQGTLADTHGAVRRTLADWTAPNDPLTKVRLDNLRNLVRDKAGSKGQGNNHIDRVTLLACLEVDDERDLLSANCLNAKSKRSTWFRKS